MGFGADIDTFSTNLLVDNTDEINTSIGELAKKLNKEYYDLTDNTSENIYLVGSMGRGTSIKGVSDIDLIFNLPIEVYDKYNAYTSNGQSALLQEIKGCLLSRYPKTDISGDGQVVVIDFAKYTVELVPGFIQSDKSFIYPDANDGGSWEITKPLDEIIACNWSDTFSNGNYKKVCKMMRSWRNYVGFPFGGLLIDTLVNDFFENHTIFKYSNSEKYLELFKYLFKYFMKQDKDQEYWIAPGSKQEVYNKNHGVFVNKANLAYEKIKDLDVDSSSLNDYFREIFGPAYPEKPGLRHSDFVFGARNTEEFIEDKMSVDIRYELRIDCKVRQNGFLEHLLREMQRKHLPLKINKHLEFYIVRSNVPEPYDIYWKVKNVGDEAIRRDQIRGEIKRTNVANQIEQTNFRGAHFVECYIVKNGVCVARDRIQVPIEI